MKNLFYAVAFLAAMCLSAQASKAQTLDWQQQLTYDASSMVVVTDMATNDVTGSTYVLGYYEGTINFGLDSHLDTVTAMNRDGFMLMLDPQGEFEAYHLWTPNRSAGSFLPEGIVVDDNGNYYVTGRFKDFIVFSPGNYKTQYYTGAGSASFIVKYNQDGDFEWVNVYNGNNNQHGHSVALTPSEDRVFMAGAFANSSNGLGISFFPGQAATLAHAGRDAFVASYDASTGDIQWLQHWGDSTFSGSASNDNRALDVAASATGVYVTGRLNGDIYFDPTDTASLQSAGSNTSQFVTKLDTAGAFQWAHYNGGTSLSEGRSIALDSDENVYFALYFGNWVNVDPAGHANHSLYAGAGKEIGMASYQQRAGTIRWSFHTGSSNDCGPFELAVDSNDDVYLTGYFSNSSNGQGVDFDPSGSSAVLLAGGRDFFLAKYSQAGAYVWAVEGGDYDGQSYGTAVSTFGNNVYASGYFNDSLALDPGASILVANGSQDGFVAAYSSTGTRLANASETPATLQHSQAYPNPFSHSLYLGWAGEANSATVQVVGMDGRTWLPTQTLKKGQALKGTQQLAPGLYMLVGTFDNGQRISQRIIKQ